MKYKQLKFREGFRVAIGNRKSQVAEMVLKPGDSEGDPGNRHRGSDQWLFVISGKGMAVVNARKRRLKSGVLLHIEKGDLHEIKNDGKELLRTLNVYVPPAYTKSGDPLPRGRR